MRPLSWVTNPVFAGTQALVLMILPMGLPVLVPLQIFAPLPVLLTALWGGAQSAWIGATIPVVGAFLLGDGLRFPLTAFLLFFGFPMLAAHLIRAGWRVNQCLASAFLLGMGALLLLFVWSLVMGLDMQAETALQLDGFKNKVLAAIAKEGGNAVVLTEARAVLTPILDMLSLLMPAFVVSGWFLMHVVNLLAARFLVRRWGGEGLFAGEDLTEWRPPFQLVWVVIASGVFAYAAQGFSRQLGANLFLLFTILYFLQGMAIIQAGFRHHAVAGVWRTLFYLALFFWHQVVLFVAAVGLFDIWVDFRKRFFRTSHDGDDSPGSE
ncbi:hypothetical protein SIID45300_00301 [Candidatus Magnetaquicoccaceae bacterium FCR-1]|uniref:Uncharacterized protein n=1 Tax=Candidatus Magnetaquiglobus chichijimensis TaxID=3141448 RepID=A0ABQ0C540_9PROT